MNMLSSILPAIVPRRGNAHPRLPALSRVRRGWPIGRHASGPATASGPRAPRPNRSAVLASSRAFAIADVPPGGCPPEVPCHQRGSVYACHTLAPACRADWQQVLCTGVDN